MIRPGIVIYKRNSILSSVQVTRFSPHLQSHCPVSLHEMLMVTAKPGSSSPTPCSQETELLTGGTRSNSNEHIDWHKCESSCPLSWIQVCRHCDYGSSAEGFFSTQTHLQQIHLIAQIQYLLQPQPLCFLACASIRAARQSVILCAPPH